MTTPTRPAPPVSPPEPPVPYRLLTEALPAITYIVHLLPSPHTTYISPQVTSILGFSAQEWLSDPDFWLRQIPSEDRERIANAMQLHNRTGDPFFLEHRCLTRQGQTIWLRNSATYQRDDAGRLVTVHGVMVDITEKKQAEEALRESEARNRAFIHALPDIFFINRRDGTYLDVHSSDPSLLAAPPGDICNHKLRDILPAPVADQCSQAIDQALATNTLQEIHYSLLLGDQTRHFEARISPCTEETTLTIVRDITERVVNEQLLRSTQQSYLDVFNAVGEAIYVQDKTGTFIDVNRGAETMYRCSRKDLIGKTPADVAAPGQNDLEDIQRLSEAVFRTGQPAHFTFWAVRQDGDIFPKEITINKGRYFGKDVLIAIARDISEKINAEAERDKLRSQLEQAQRLESVGRLAGGVAHDFNNMLQSIIGYAELALDDASGSPPLHHAVNEIHKAAQRSTNLTRQLLAFARKQPIAPRLLDLNTAVTDTLDMLQRLMGSGIQIAWHPAPHVCPVAMDPSQLDQILVNLCVNARDAMSGQGILTIETGTTTLRPDDALCHADATPGPFTVLAVRDNGVGMDTHSLAHVFEPFFTTKGPGEGTGLGLATVYGIVRQNDGCIEVDSEPDCGTSFEIHLPQPADSAILSSAPPAPAQPTPGTETLLVVEDDAAILDLTTRHLSRLGYTLLTASSPNDALRIARTASTPIHMLVTDVIMPDMNGRQLAEQIIDRHPDIRCLYISGYSADIIAPNGIVEDGIHFLQKPFSMSTLATRIRTILDAPPSG